MGCRYVMAYTPELSAQEGEEGGGAMKLGHLSIWAATSLILVAVGALALVVNHRISTMQAVFLQHDIQRDKDVNEQWEVLKSMNNMLHTLQSQKGIVKKLTDESAK